MTYSTSASSPAAPQHLFCPSFAVNLSGQRWNTLVIIPTAFERIYGRELTLSGPQMSLRTCNGAWNVTKYISANQPSTQALTTGWPEFIADNELVKGDQLTFTFDSMSSFTVGLYDERGISKNMLYAMNYISRLGATGRQASTPYPAHGPAPAPPPHTIHHHCITQIIPLTQSRVYNMTIPTPFFRAAGLHKLSAVTLSNAASHKWLIKLGQCRLGRGWTAFRKDNDLKVGDNMLLRCSFRASGKGPKLKMFKIEPTQPN